MECNYTGKSSQFALQSSVKFHVETSHLIYIANQMTDFYMKCNTGLQWVNLVK